MQLLFAVDAEQPLVVEIKALTPKEDMQPTVSDWRASGAIAPRYKALALSVAMNIPLTFLTVQLLCMTAAATFILSRPDRAVRDLQPAAHPLANREPSATQSS